MEMKPDDKSAALLWPLAAAMALAAVLTGCGTPGAPQAPSLKLPDRVGDLAAVRTGNQVALTWTMPKKSTDKLLLKGDVSVTLCRREGTAPCAPIGTALQLAPGANGTFTETLSGELANGAPRPVSYFVELRNQRGRSSGLSNTATLLAGQAPTPLTGLSAEVRRGGIVLRWTAATGDETAVRLHRTLVTPGTAKVKAGLLDPDPEPAEQSLLVEPSAQAAGGRALDTKIRFGQTYEYRAQRVARVNVNGETLELAGELSAPVRVAAINSFPPAVPTGLAAVAVAGDNGAAPAIDLSWQPGAEADLAGYVVYRREGQGGWQRISPAEPLAAPAFHDATVQAGHAYHYAVSATDEDGHESARSAAAEETVPNP